MPKERACIIHPNIKTEISEDLRTAESKLEEAIGLAQAIDLEVAIAKIVSIPRVIPSLFLGKGKAEEIQQWVEAESLSLVIIDDSLSPIQQRNLERLIKCKVIDRTALILEIFGERAQTKEGTLQVQLAAFEYQKSRLVRSWTHLERQRGGKGFMGGPGETQIESDRRVLREQIGRVKRQIKKVVQTRSLHRKSRKKVPFPIVALVGYTNAGKSTLFNRLTDSHVVAKDQLFATLDPTMRLIKLPSGRQVILSDTVGFISNLPTELVAAFRATLEEVVEADILLHVRDISHEETTQQRRDVYAVLNDLLPEKEVQQHTMEVLNKVDRLDEAVYEQLKDEKECAHLVSAINGDGVDDLLEAIDAELLSGWLVKEIMVPQHDGRRIAWLHAHGEVIGQHLDDSGMHLQVRLSEKDYGRWISLTKE